MTADSPLILNTFPSNVLVVNQHVLKFKNHARTAGGAIGTVAGAAGKPYYDPAEIEVPVMLIHGEWDVDVPVDIAWNYFTHLTGAPQKRWIEIGEATHMLMLEKNRRQPFDSLIGFMREDFA